MFLKIIVVGKTGVTNTSFLWEIDVSGKHGLCFNTRQDLRKYFSLGKFEGQSTYLTPTRKLVDNIKINLRETIYEYVFCSAAITVLFQENLNPLKVI
jgi:hypothetical protein